MPRKTPPLPLPVRRALKKLGKDVREARLRRRIRTTVMADRVQVSRPTLRKLEQGDPSVSIGAYATALYVLGLVDRLADLADIAADPVGRQMASEALPQRIASKILEGDDLSASLDLAFAAAGTSASRTTRRRPSRNRLQERWQGGGAWREASVLPAGNAIEWRAPSSTRAVRTLRRLRVRSEVGLVLHPQLIPIEAGSQVPQVVHLELRAVPVQE